MKTIMKCIVIMMPLVMLCGCQQHDYAFRVRNMNNYKISIEKQYFNIEREYPLPDGGLGIMSATTSYPFFVLPDNEVPITWSSSTGKKFSYIVNFQVPESFTPKAGKDITLVFQANKIFVCYAIFYGPATDPGNRCTRNRKFIWSKGWTFDPDDYFLYYRDKEKIPIETYAEKIAGKKLNEE